MWNEYALDPDCLPPSRERFARLLFGFSFEQGRLIASFPENWRTRLFDRIQAAPLRDAEKSWMTEHLARAKHRLLPPDHRSYDEKVSFLQNALACQDGGNPFHAIIAEHNPQNAPRVCLAADLSDGDPLWRSDATRTVDRTPAELIRPMELLLSHSQSVLLIDPYFATPDGVPRERFLRPLARLLEVLRAQRRFPQRLEYHSNAANIRTSLRLFKDRMRDGLAPLLRKGQFIDFVGWRPRKSPRAQAFHDRFIVTELGGAGYTYGLDDGPEGETTGVQRLSAEDHARVLENFSLRSQTYELTLRFRVLPA